MGPPLSAKGVRITAWLNQRLAANNRFDAADVFAAFNAAGRRPEILTQILKDIALEGGAGELAMALQNGAAALRRQLREEYEATSSGLTPLQQAVLERLGEEGARCAPFSAASRAAYTAAVGEAVEAPTAQTAIEALRQRNLVWRSARGQYALEDQGLADWLREKIKPPFRRTDSRRHER